MMKSFYCLAAANVFLFGCQSVLGQEWPVEYRQTPENLPQIELSLAAPLQPWPQVAAELGSLDETREKLEADKMAGIQRSYNVALESAKKKIGESIGRAMQVFDDAKSLQGGALLQRVSALAFLAQRPLEESAGLGDTQIVKVNVPPVAPPHPALKQKMEDIELKRSEREENMFNQAKEELEGLTDLVVAELESSIQVHIARAFSKSKFPNPHGNATSFMTLSNQEHQEPKQASVRVVASDIPYPTVASMFADMEKRRDVSEYLEQQIILEKELHLLTAENEIIKDGLAQALQRVLAQHKLAAVSAS